MIHVTETFLSLSITAGDAPMMVFAVKELSMHMSILGKWEENPYTQMYLFKFHIDFISHVAGGVEAS